MKGDGHNGHKLRIRLTKWRQAVQDHGACSPEAYRRWNLFEDARREALQKHSEDGTVSS